MNMVLEKNIPALQQSIRDLDNQCQGALKQSVMDFVQSWDQSWGVEELTGQRTMYNINIFCYSHHPRQFHLWFLKQKKNEITREKLQQFFFFWLRASDRNTFPEPSFWPQYHHTAWTSSVHKSFRPITRQTFLGRYRKAINLIETRARFQAGAKTRRSLRER